MRARTLLFIAVVAWTATELTLPISDPDLWWHITVGRWILSHKEVPTVDLWNAYAENLPWRAYSWSNEVVYAAVELLSGVRGLIVLSLLLSTALCASLAYCLGKSADDWVIGLGLSGCTAAALMAHADLRPQTLSWLLFLWMLYLVRLIDQRGIDKRNGLALFLVAVAWANTHLSMVLGLGTAGLWLLDPKRPKESSSKIVSTLAIAIAGSLCTPYFGAEWLTFFAKAEHPLSHLYIKEFQPVTLYDTVANIVLLLFVILCLLLQQQPKALRPPQVIAAIIFVIAGFTIAKILPFAAILCSLLIAEIWQSQQHRLRAFGNLGEALNRGADKIRRMPAWLHGALSIAAAALIVLNIIKLWTMPVNWQRIPKDAVDFIEDNALPAPLLNSFNEGGYLIYRFSNDDGTPRQKVVMDGRTNVNDEEVVKGFVHALGADSQWRSIFELVQPKTVIWPSRFPLVTVLYESPEWCRVFPVGDSAAQWSVFLRKEEHNARKAQLPSADCP